MPDEKFDCYAVCSPGIEKFTAQELIGLGIKPAEYAQGDGGVSFAGNWNTIYSANLWLRTATRVLVRIFESKVITFAELVAKAARIPWELYIKRSTAITIRTTCVKSRLYHSDAVSERVRSAIGKRLGFDPKSSDYDEESVAPLRIVVRIAHDNCVISIDTSGTALYKRGYRQAVGKAPLRETLAASMIYASAWDCKSPLIDPFCGTGVIPIEAALMASNVPPGSHRSFSFQRFPNYKPDIWQHTYEVSLSQHIKCDAAIIGADRDAKVIGMAQENADRAGVAGLTSFECKPLSSWAPTPSPGWIVTNPPYGTRISENQDIRALYNHFGGALRQNFPGWNVAYLANDEEIASLTRLKFAKGVSMNNGGIPVKLSIAKVPA